MCSKLCTILIESRVEEVAFNECQGQISAKLPRSPLMIPYTSFLFALALPCLTFLSIHPMDSFETQSPVASRPYRSHKFPACRICRSRKIRCNVEAGQKSCTFCRDTGRLCEYVDDSGSTHKRRKTSGRSETVNASRNQCELAAAISGTSPTESGVILEPALAEDVEALEHYLTAYGPEAVSSAKPYRTVSTARDGKPVVYLTVPRRRKGLHNHEVNPGVKNREVMENVLGPLRQHVIDL